MILGIYLTNQRSNMLSVIGAMGIGMFAAFAICMFLDC